MTFRTRLFLAFMVAVLLPLGLLAWGVRREVERRLLGEYGERLDGAAASIDAELAGTREALAGRLAGLAADLAGDNRLRLALRGDAAARRALLDWGVAASRVSGLALLEVQDSGGRILTSGHFRNEYDRRRPELPSYLVAAAAPALVRARTADGTVLALAMVDSIAIAAQRVVIVGGVRFGDDNLRRLTPDPRLAVRLSLPGAEAPLAGDESVAREVRLPFLDLAAGTPPAEARLLLVQSTATLGALRRSLDRWFAAALAAAAALGLLAAAWLTARVTLPLRRLAQRTASVDLDRLDQDFSSDSPDEIGTLTRGLGAMIARLRAGAARLREAERRIATGDLARQINHDIKNGLVPIRNVLHHLDEVAPTPDALAAVYGERRGTLETSVGYLETLARNYARLTPVTAREPCDIAAVVHEVIRAVPPDGAAVRAAVDPAVGPVLGDRLAIRRILENLVANAVDSVRPKEGSVEVSAEPGRRDDGAAVVRVSITDTGPGMTRDELERAFDDFYTTKDGGTGLGLSIVRRLVLDLGGALRVDTRPGEGTRVTIELPSGEAS